MNRRGFSLIEVAIATTVFAVVVFVAVQGVSLLGRQSKTAYETLAQAQDVELLMETIRQELTAMVMNPLPAGQHHEGNSFLRSEPNHTGIQFVATRQTPTGMKRCLVSYLASNVPGAPATAPLKLRKDVFEFTNEGPWTDRIQASTGWPAAWIGARLESEESRFNKLNVMDIRWNFRDPPVGEGRVFFRVDLVVLGREGKRLLPFTTLVSVSTSGDPSSFAACPCLFQPCFNPADPNCCLRGGQ